MEQQLLEPVLDLPLSQDNLFDVPCDKEELCVEASIIPMPQLVINYDTFDLEPTICVERKNFFPLLVNRMS
uniref:Uncharacterized protein n=1 Tax=Arundo donax TaxID=35708 RepID=A0A0A9DNJ9_ARUDO